MAAAQPVLVQTDPSWFAVVSVFATCAVIGVIGERVFSRPRWAALGIPLAVVDTASEDIHGLPFLAGFGLALFWRWRDAR